MAYAKVANGLDYLRNKLQSLDKNKSKNWPKKWKLRGNRTYIIPSGFGFAFGTLSFVLLVMAIGYANNVLYFFVFLLISMALTGMWETNKNIDSLKVEFIEMNSIYAFEDNEVQVYFQNKNHKTSLYEIELQFLNIQSQKKNNNTKALQKVDEIEVGKKVFVTWKPEHRGELNFPRLQMQSRFPFRMFKAWKYFDQNTNTIVYPRRKGETVIPKNSGNNNDKEQQQAFLNQQGLFRDFRDFEKSDSTNRIDWKRSLKHQRHLVKNFETSEDRRILLAWRMTQSLSDFEDKISQLALWVDICHKQKIPYSLQLKNEKTEFDSSANHYKDCMTKLALLKMVDIDEI